MSCRSLTLLLKTLFQLTHPIETYPFGMDFCRLSPTIPHSTFYHAGNDRKVTTFLQIQQIITK